MKNKTIKKVLNRLKKYRFAIVVSILLAAVTAAAALYVPKIVGEAIDLIVGKNDVDFGGIASLLVHLHFCDIYEKCLRRGIPQLSLRWLMNGSKSFYWKYL